MNPFNDTIKGVYCINQDLIFVIKKNLISLFPYPGKNIFSIFKEKF